jgi:hypothetical protein
LIHAPRRSPRRSVTTPTYCRARRPHQLDRLQSSPSISLGDDLGVAELHLVALAAHRLDEDGELQLAAAEHEERVGVSVGSTRIAEVLPSPRARGAP